MIARAKKKRHNTFGFGNEPLTDEQWRLVWENRGLGYSMLARWQWPPDIDRDELFHDCALPGLVRAARSWRRDGGAKFSTYACWAIRSSIVCARSRAAQKWLRSNVEELSEDFAAGRDCGAAAELAELSAFLAPRERQLVELLAQGHQLGHAADVLGVSRQTINRMKAAALAKMRKRGKTK